MVDVGLAADDAYVRHAAITLSELVPGSASCTSIATHWSSMTSIRFGASIWLLSRSLP
jgi:hypothetical protein